MLKMSLSSLITWNITSSLLTILPARFPRTWLAIIEISPECLQDEADISELVVDQVQLLVAVWLVLVDGCVAGGCVTGGAGRRLCSWWLCVWWRWSKVVLLVAVWLAALVDGCVAGGSALSATHRRVYATFIVFRFASKKVAYAIGFGIVAGVNISQSVHVISPWWWWWWWWWWWCWFGDGSGGAGVMIAGVSFLHSAHVINQWWWWWWCGGGGAVVWWYGGAVFDHDYQQRMLRCRCKVDYDLWCRHRVRHNVYQKVQSNYTIYNINLSGLVDIIKLVSRHSHGGCSNIAECGYPQLCIVLL